MSKRIFVTATVLLFLAGSCVPAFARGDLNHAPVVDAGPDVTTATGYTITLQGSATDVDKDTMSDWEWTVTSAPANAVYTLEDSHNPTSTFKARTAGTYVLSLKAYDSTAWSDSDSVTISVVQNQPPVAIATATPSSGYTPLKVVFDSSQSYDPEGGTLSCYWIANSCCVISTDPSFTWICLASGNIQVTLVVGDEDEHYGGFDIFLTVYGGILLMVGETGYFDASWWELDKPWITTHDWDWDDDSAHGSGAQTTHSYSTAGDYTVTLAWTCIYGHSGTQTTSVHVVTAADAIDQLVTMVEDMNLDNGIDNSLDQKLQNAKDALECVNADKTEDAVNKLKAFINEVQAQSGKKLTVAQADVLTDYAQWIVDNI